MIRFLNAALALGAALALPALPAAAQQNPSGGSGGGPPASERPAPTLPEAKLPGSSGSSSPDRSGTMSEDLSRSGGVIQPPTTIDSGIKQPTPSPGPQSMPVIPPPGTPGGNRNVEPK